MRGNNLKDYILYWSKLEDELQEKNNEIRKIREQKEKLNKHISKYLVENNLEKNIFNLNNDTTIKCKTINTKDPINQTYLKRQLLNYFGNEQQANNLYNYLQENRQTKTNYVLSKTTNTKLLTANK